MQMKPVTRHGRSIRLVLPISLTAFLLSVSILAADVSVEREAIRWVQQTLQECGFDPGSIDGLWGSRTETAAADYVLSHGAEPSYGNRDLLVKQVDFYRTKTGPCPASQQADVETVSEITIVETVSETASDDQAVACRVGLILQPGESCQLTDGERFGVREDGCVAERPASVTSSGKISFSTGSTSRRTTWKKGPKGEKTDVKTVNCIKGYIEINGFRATEVVDTSSNFPSLGKWPWRIDKLPIAGGNGEVADSSSATNTSADSGATLDEDGTPGQATITYSEGPTEGSLVILKFDPGSVVPAVGTTGSLKVWKTIPLFGVGLPMILGAGKCEVVSVDGNVVVVRITEAGGSITDKSDGSVQHMLPEMGSKIIFEPDG